jgi:hypothetical protein
LALNQQILTFFEIKISNQDPPTPVIIVENRKKRKKDGKKLTQEPSIWFLKFLEIIDIR